MALLLVGMVMSPALALDLQDPNDLDALGLLEGEGVVTNIRSLCFWGFYIDDNGTGVGPWDSLLFVSNASNSPQNFDVFFVTQGARILRELVNVAPNALVFLDCNELRACNSQGWLLIVSDAPIFGGTLLISNSLFGGGSLTAQTPFCIFT
jgi:hypothetical protein